MADGGHRTRVAFGLAIGSRGSVVGSRRPQVERPSSCRRHRRVWVMRVGNRLADASSPYLLQHAGNPIDWYPWGDEAFAKAQAEGKLVFLSVGYATCHWCHVMERESFEDQAVASVLNEHFVACKVDREERPDVDGIYMSFVQATSGRGGWPMNVFLTPTLVPIVGSTYIQREKFISVCTAVAAGWNEDRAKLTEDGTKVLDALRQFSALPVRDGQVVDLDAILDDAYDSAVETYDEENGGFGSAPKFPRANFLDFLLHYSAICKDAERRERARTMVFITLRKMKRGGIYDQLGGGWHRYSTDMYWHVPHFEKMLFDQSQMTSALLNAWGVSGDGGYANVATQTLEYVCHALRDDSGAFFSAQDADSSKKANGISQKDAGAYYLFSYDECAQIVDKKVFPIIEAHFGILLNGNAPEGSDPRGKMIGKNTFKVFVPPEKLAEMFDLSIDEINVALKDAKDSLREARFKRPVPDVDDKIVTGWNGLMISTFARASRQFGRPEYLDIAEEAGTFVLKNLSRGVDTKERSECLQLQRSWRNGVTSPVDGFAQDYSSMVTAAIELFCSSGKVSWLRIAIALQETLDSEFWDVESGGYFVTRKRVKHMILRRKEDQDGDEPSSSSLTALNCFRLACITGEQKYVDRAREIVAAYSVILKRYSTALPTMLCAATRINYGKACVVVCGKRESSSYKKLIQVFNEIYIPMVTLVPLPNEEVVSEDIFSPAMRAMAKQSRESGQSMAFTCLESGCLSPTTDGEILREQLHSAFATSH